MQYVETIQLNTWILKKKTRIEFRVWDWVKRTRWKPHELVRYVKFEDEFRDLDLERNVNGENGEISYWKDKLDKIRKECDGNVCEFEKRRKCM